MNKKALIFFLILRSAGATILPLSSWAKTIPVFREAKLDKRKIKFDPSLKAIRSQAVEINPLLFKPETLNPGDRLSLNLQK